MNASAPVALIGIDSGNPALLRSYARAGHLPHLARVLESSAHVEVDHEPGLFVGSIWPTMLTGTGVDHHGFYTGIRPAPHSYDYIPSPVQADPFWELIAAAGHRVAVIDAPYFPARPGSSVDHVVEWGCHDRYFGTSSTPPDLIDDVIRRVGSHPIGMIDHEYQRFSPCDWVHRDGDRRDLDEVSRLIADLQRGLEMRLELTTAMYERANYDLFVDVVAEIHCAGHQLWSLHDPSHPDHDPAMRAALGGDPLLPIYRLVDEIIGVHLDRIGPDGVAYIVASHTMRSHFDGTWLFDEILWRLDQRYRGGPTPWMGPRTTRFARSAHTIGKRTGAALGPIVRRTLGRRPVSPTDPSNIPGPAERLWYLLDNNTVCGGVRFNRYGREPQGKLDDALLGHAATWLADELRSIINIDTGEPAICDAWLTEALYERHLADGLPDLIAEWNHHQPIDRVWSPSIGTVCRPYTGTRTGDHGPTGELYVIGAGVDAGDRGRINGKDLAPTIAATMRVDLPNTTGNVVTGLIPGAEPAAQSGPGRLFDTRRKRMTSADDHSELAALRNSLIDLRTELSGLKAAHHETRVLAEAARQRADIAADIAATTSWVAEQAVSDDLTVSVVIPTKNRSECVGDAIRSVLDQSYANVEVIVVDDGSTDDTAAVLAAFTDPRLRTHRNVETPGEGGARNLGLDVACGDIICFLDDDNTFDRNWLRHVVWLFETQPDTQIAYGARLVDDHRRHHHGISGGLPHLELNEWDDEVMAQRNLVDINVLAHRRGAVRFQRDLPLFTDWAYLLELSASNRPVRLPVIAARYTTDRADRVSVVDRADHDEVLARVRTQSAARRSADRSGPHADDEPGVQASNA